MEKVLEITKLAMEVNEQGKYQVFVSIAPHVKAIDLSVNEGKWHKDIKNIFKGHFHYEFELMDDKGNYERMRDFLIKLKGEREINE